MTKASFGKFHIVGQIARGGMAEVFLCRLQGIGGFEKEVVVKCIIPERADDPNFVTMFLDEARVAANLSHPGIVQVFEIGEDDGIPYIAMEYVRGVTLDLVIRALQRQRKMHYGHCAKIISGICEALDYAHNAVGSDGEPLALVHRDVSPGNIVVSREGVPKLLDFGVAKTNRRLAETEAGTLKGKLRYMAPEQVALEPIDHRADIFSLGVCLYELTTGYHPFGPEGESDVAMLKSMVEGETIKPSTFVSGYPRELEEIVLAAIERPVNRRIPTARVMHDRLEAFIARGGHPSTSRDVVAWLRDLIPDLGALTKTGTFGALGAMAPGVKTAPAPSPSGGANTRASTRLTAVSPAADLSQAGARRYRLRRSAASRLKVGLAVAGGLGLLGLAIWLFRPVPDVVLPPARGPVTVLSDDETARQYLDAAERLAAQERFEPAQHMLTKASELKVRNVQLNIRLAQLRDNLATATLIRQAASHLRGKQWRPALEVAKSALERSPESPEALRIAAAAQAALAPRPPARTREVRREGTLTISTTPSAMVFIDDAPIGRAPLRRQVAAGPHRVEARLPGYRPGQAQVRVVAKRTVALVLPLVAEGQTADPKSRRAEKPETVALTRTSLVGPDQPRTAPVVSARPLEPTPKPTLPRLLRATESERLWRVCQLVELLAVSRAGVTREFARGITAPLRRTVAPGALVYPVAMYYFIVQEAALKHDNVTAAANLAAAHRDGSIVKLNDLPAVERDL